MIRICIEIGKNDIKQQHYGNISSEKQKIKMKIVKINNKKYINYKNIIEKYPKMWVGCKTAIEFINRNKIESKHIIYAREKNGKWKETNGKSRRFDKLHISYIYYEETINNENDEDKSDDEDEYDEEPDEIELTDDEKFRNDKGKIVNIKVIGERDSEKCFFNVNDMKDAFCIPKIRTVLTNKNRGYKYQIHYVYFSSAINDGKHRIKKVMYLTYRGILKILFSSRKTIAESYISWATKTLFTAHIGSKKQKRKLAGDLLGITPNIIKTVFNASATTFPCIYLIELGTVKELKKSIKINKRYDNDDKVYKWGFTKDLKNRMQVHASKYEKKFDIEINLVYYGYIDPQYTTQAESHIRTYMTDIASRINGIGEKELSVISDKLLRSVKKQYDIVTERYIGRVKELKDEIIQKDHEIEILKKDHELEILKLKLQISEQKINQ